MAACLCMYCDTSIEEKKVPNNLSYNLYSLTIAHYSSRKLCTGLFYKTT